MIKFLVTGLVTFSAAFSLAFEASNNAKFPQGPDPILTPGELCSTGNIRRYPEGIRYCPRDVQSDEKRNIIDTYDKARGFQVGQMPRGQFKIDHYIPLCAGGSNERDNLWPQHESIYNVTDPLEAAICEKMSQGKLKQADAIAIIKQGKADLSSVASLLDKLKHL